MGSGAGREALAQAERGIRNAGERQDGPGDLADEDRQEVGRGEERAAGRPAAGRVVREGEAGNGEGHAQAAEGRKPGEADEARNEGRRDRAEKERDRERRHGGAWKERPGPGQALRDRDGLAGEPEV